MVRGEGVVRVALVATIALGGCTTDLPGDSPDTPADPPVQSHRVYFQEGRLVPEAAPPAGEPRFNYVQFNERAAEPNIGITSSGAIFVTAWEDTLRSIDGGRSWELVHSHCTILGVQCDDTDDPMLWVDQATDRVWVNHMIFEESSDYVPLNDPEVTTGCLTMLWSDDEGDTWTQRDAACGIPRVDHQKVVLGPPGPEPNPHASAMQYPSVAYTCFNNRIQSDVGMDESQTSCVMSYDGGLTYPLQTNAFDGTTACGGVAGHPAIAPDGTIVVPAAAACGPEVAVSRDSGLNWQVYDGPQGEGVAYAIDPDVAFDEDGTLYFMWRDGSHMIRVARSDDQGKTWDPAWNATFPGVTSTRFHALTAGNDGRVAMAYLGTTMPRGTSWSFDGEERTWAGAPDDAPPGSLWHLYIVTFEDNGTAVPVFSGYQVTTDDDPVQKGCTSVSGGPRACRNLLDFIDTAMAPDGTFYVAYTEGCTVRAGCAGNATTINEMDARDNQIALAWLKNWSLLADPTGA